MNEAKAKTDKGAAMGKKSEKIVAGLLKALERRLQGEFSRDSKAIVIDRYGIVIDQYCDIKR